MTAARQAAAFKRLVAAGFNAAVLANLLRHFRWVSLQQEHNRRVLEAGQCELDAQKEADRRAGRTGMWNPCPPGTPREMLPG